MLGIQSMGLGGWHFGVYGRASQSCLNTDKGEGHMYQVCHGAEV